MLWNWTAFSVFEFRFFKLADFTLQYVPQFIGSIEEDAELVARAQWWWGHNCCPCLLPPETVQTECNRNVELIGFTD